MAAEVVAMETVEEQMVEVEEEEQEAEEVVLAR